jgi:uncharacterized damage-inducible protein DinB
MKTLPDFETEMANTRRVLERVPQDKLGWKPDEKSGTMGWLAGHVATIPSWGMMTITTPDLVLDGMKPPPPPETTEALLAVFDKGVSDFRNSLDKATDEDLGHVWKCTWNGQILVQAPRFIVLRGTVMNHMIHHRAQLTMYLRLCGVPVPGLYGPSADEMPVGTGANA